MVDRTADDRPSPRAVAVAVAVLLYYVYLQISFRSVMLGGERGGGLARWDCIYLRGSSASDNCIGAGRGDCVS